MIDLSDVTLCTADTAMIPLAARAMRLSMERCRFADAIMFSDRHVDGEFRTVKIDKMDRAGYQAFRMKPPRVETPFTLWIEWDGYVLEPRAWHPAFREFDYIGARFGPNTSLVGNSGFCLQSRKFNDALADERLAIIEGYNLDYMICLTYHQILEREFGMKFAPPGLADLFSYEAPMLPKQPTFGFHGLGSMWRYCSDDEIAKIIEQVPPYVLSSPQLVTLIWNYATQCKYAVVERLFITMRKCHSREILLGAFRSALKAPHGDDLFALCESMVQL